MPTQFGLQTEDKLFEVKKKLLSMSHMDTSQTFQLAPVFNHVTLIVLEWLRFINYQGDEAELTESIKKNGFQFMGEGFVPKSHELELNTWSYLSAFCSQKKE